MILDDVLSAVDASTARHLYQRCLKGELVTGRTILLVTHNVGLVLPGTAYAVVLDSGNVLAAGDPSDLCKEGHFAEDGAPDQDIAVDEAAYENNEIEPENPLKGLASGRPEDQKKSDRSSISTDTFIKAERQEQGMVGWSTYQLYFSSYGSTWFWIPMIILFIGTQVTQVETNAWIRTWVNAGESASLPFSKRSAQTFFTEFAVPGLSRHGTAWYMGIYVAINVLFALMVAARITWLLTGSLQASRSLYERLLRRIFGARIRWVFRPL